MFDVLLAAGVDGFRLWTWTSSASNGLSGEVPHVLAASAGAGGAGGPTVRRGWGVLTSGPWQRDGLQPAVAAGQPIQPPADADDYSDDQDVAVLPRQLGHVVKVHPVDPGDRARHQRDRRPGGDLAHVLVLLDGDLVLPDRDLRL